MKTRIVPKPLEKINVHISMTMQTILQLHINNIIIYIRLYIFCTAWPSYRWNQSFWCLFGQIQQYNALWIGWWKLYEFLLFYTINPCLYSSNSLISCHYKVYLFFTHIFCLIIYLFLFFKSVQNMPCSNSTLTTKRHNFVY